MCTPPARRAISTFVLIVLVLATLATPLPAHRLLVSSAYAQSGGQIVVTPSVLPVAGAELVNPLRGLYRWRDGEKVDVVVGTNEDTFDDYERFDWRDLEGATPASSDAEYNFSKIDAQIADAMATTDSAGNPKPRQRLIFGVREQAGPGDIRVPAYLDNDATMYSANGRKFIKWNSPYFLERRRALFAALGRRYDGDPRISMVQILGSQYGEWTGYSPACNDAHYPTQQTKKELVDMVIDNFPTTRLLTGSQDSDIGLYGMQRNPRIGWFRNSLGDESFNKNLHENYNPTNFGSGSCNRTGTAAKWNLIRTRWRTAPVMTEFFYKSSPSDITPLLEQSVKDVAGWHVSQVSNGNISLPLTTEQAETLRRAGRNAGYRMVLARAAYPSTVTAGETISFTADWRNDGIAPTYEPWSIVYQLRPAGAPVTTAAAWEGRSSEILENLITQDYNDLTFQPVGSNTPERVSDSFALPEGLAGGSYEVSVIVRDPDAQAVPAPAFVRKPMKLAIEGVRGDGSYLLGTLTVEPASAPPTSTPTPSATPTQTPSPTTVPTSTSTPSPTATLVPSLTPSLTPTTAPSLTPTATATTAPTLTASATSTSTPTTTSTSTPTATSTSTPTATATSVPSATPTTAPTFTPTSTPTATAEPTATATSTATATATPVPTATATSTPSSTPSSIPSSTATASPTATPTTSPTASATPTTTASPTPTPTGTPAPSLTPTPTSAPSLTPTPTSTATPTRTSTATPTSTASPTPTRTSTPTSTPPPATPSAPQFEAAADSYVSGGAATTNYGTASSLQVRDGTGTTLDHITYLRFDLSSLPATAASRALLSFNVTGIGDTSRPANVSVFAVSNDAWSETGITWNNRPATSGTALATVAVTAGQGSIDLAPFVSQQLGGDKIVSLALTGISSNNNLVTIASRNNTAGLAKPRLQVTPAQRIAQPAAADAYVRGGASQAIRYGTASVLEVKDAQSADADRQTYLRFDLRAVSVGSVQRATLRLYHGPLSDNRPAALRVLAVASDSWSESAIAWNNRPAGGAQQAALSIPVSQGGWIELDVTAYVNAQLAVASDKQASLVLLDAVLSNSLVSFNSRENSANRPVLELIVP